MFGGSEQSMVTLSVRSAFDLYLQAASFPPGSEMIVTAVNVPQMAKIIEHHGLKIIPVDIDLETLSPSVNDLESLVTSKTVAVLVAHLYGHWVDMSPIVSVAKKHAVAVLEDCAQAFGSFKRLGHPDAVASFFSFGAIKTCTAFGGAVSVIRDKEILQKMRQIQSRYPLLSRRTFLFRLFRYCIVATCLNLPAANYCGRLISGLIGLDHKEYFIGLLRGFPVNFPDVLRYQPPAGLLRTMSRHLKNFEKKGTETNSARCQFVEERLPETVQMVGSKALCPKSYWLFPILVRDSVAYIKHLNAYGVDAYSGATQLTVIEPESHQPTSSDTSNSKETSSCSETQNILQAKRWEGADMEAPRGDTGEYRRNTKDSDPVDSLLSDWTDQIQSLNHYPHQARYLIEHVVYLPVHKLVPVSELEKICNVLEDAARVIDGERHISKL
jgi:hypothetical protein